MSDQEMQFADPEWQPPRQRRYTYKQAPYIPAAANDPPRQQTGDQTAASKESEETADPDYSRGYRAEQPGYQYAQEQPAQRPRRWRRPRFWVILAAIALLILFFSLLGEDFLAFWGVLLEIVVACGIIALIVMFFIAFSRRHSVSSTETHTFSVGTQPKIILKEDVGTIRVHAGGEERQVVIQATKRSHILLGDNIKVGYDQNTARNSITVKVNNGWSLFGKKWVDFDITVPRLTDLELKSDAGSISVDGICGQLSCATDAGSVKATGVRLRGHSKLKTDAGSVTFSGALDPTGSYQMTTDAGNVNITLPEDASFRLDAKTDVGTINSDFPLDIQRDFPGGKARCDIGFSPRPSLKLRTDVGTITIRQAGTSAV